MQLPHLHQCIDEITPKIICLQETWLETENNIYLKEYQHPMHGGTGETGEVVEYAYLLWRKCHMTSFHSSESSKQLQYKFIYQIWKYQFAHGTFLLIFRGRSLLKDLMISLPTSHIHSYSQWTLMHIIRVIQTGVQHSLMFEVKILTCGW